MGPGSWAVCVLLFWIVALPLYFIKRGAIERAAYDEDSDEDDPHHNEESKKELKAGVANKIGSLPKISSEFNVFCKGHEFTKNEWMPCPQCGSKEVEKPSGAGTGAAAGVAMMGCLGVVFFIVTIFAVIFLGPIGWGIGVAGILLVILSPFLGAGLGSMYKCKSCSLNWTFSNVEEFVAAPKQNS